MLKKFLTISFLFLFSFANSAFAHTHIESSSPQNGEVLTEQLNEITLTFEGKIEQSSSFTLQKADGEAVQVDSVTVSDNVLIGSLSTPLENGEYSINWSIIGADGHVIQGEVPFTVDIPDAETTDNTSDAKANNTDVNVSTEGTDAAAEQELAVDEPVEDTSSSYLAPTLIGVLILIVIGSFIFIAKRKQ